MVEVLKALLLLLLVNPSSTRKQNKNSRFSIFAAVANLRKKSQSYLFLLLPPLLLLLLPNMCALNTPLQLFCFSYTPAPFSLPLSRFYPFFLSLWLSPTLSLLHWIEIRSEDTAVIPISKKRVDLFFENSLPKKTLSTSARHQPASRVASS